MKPISIKMQAFGSYLSPTECDFSKLYENRLFLITGPTGCGKTTILDAMSFALYGSATGDLRSFRDMRSTRAPADLDTEVTYIFELGGVQYKFTRTVHIYKKRSGETEERVTGECSVKNGEEWNLLASGSESTSKQAEALLHFTHSQFSQVIVLPQGEFRRLLLASSKEKLEILQVLFALTRWQRIAELLQQRLRGLRESMGLSLQQQSILLENAEAESIDSLEILSKDAAALFESAKRKVTETDAIFKTEQEKYAAAMHLAEQFSALDTEQKKLSDLLKQADEINAQREEISLYEKLNRLLPLFKQKKFSEQSVQNQELMLKDAQERYVKANAELKTAEKNAGNIDDKRAEERTIRDEIAKIEQLLPEAQRLSEYRKSLLEYEALCDKAAAEKQAAAEKTEVLDGRIAKGSQYLAEQFEKFIQPSAGWQEQKSRLSEALKNLLKLDTVQASTEKLQAENSRAKQELEREKAALTAAEHACEHIERLMRMDLAHSLAVTLEDDLPCPVCGSLHHPSPAKAPDGSPEKAESEACKAVLAQCRKTVDAASSKAADIATRLAASVKEQQELNAVCATISMNADEVKAKIDELSQLIEQAERSNSAYPELTKKLEELKLLRAKAVVELEESGNRKSEFDSKIAAEKAKINEIVRKLPENTDYLSVKAECDEKKRRADEIKALADSLEAALNHARLSNSKAETELSGAKAALANANLAFDNALHELEMNCALADISPDIDFENLIIPEEQAKSIKKAILDYDNQLAFCKQRTAELSIALSGKNPPALDAVKLSFENAKLNYENAMTALGTLEAKAKFLEDTLLKIRKLIEARNDVEQDYSSVCRVADFVSGKNSSRTPLQNFVLGLILDDVMQAASRYLLKLSRGRYSLVRVDVNNASALHGLDIEVTDAHTGGQRKVCTLSGGELFLASLSLAFGLSEVVQSYSGGVYLDSIFIDEGFGSLDAETLDAAMRALSDIQSEGRLVGIISHVSELKERIPSRIEIIPSEKGSQILITAI